MTPDEAPRTPPDGDAEAKARRDRKRRSALLNHFIAYFGVMVLLVPINFVTTPDYVWFVFPLVLWGAPLAVHTAYAMGLLDGLLKRK